MENDKGKQKQMEFMEIFRQASRRIMYMNNNKSMFEKFRETVFEYAKAHLDKTDDNSSFTLDDVYIVWCSKALQNWKALISTNLRDGMYYELTYNGDKDELYLDAYKKFDNKVYAEYSKED